MNKLILTVFMLVFVCVQSQWGVAREYSKPSHKAPKTLVVQMLGEGEWIGDLPTVWHDVFGSEAGLPDDNADFNCFSVPLLDPSKGKEIGTGIDCLRPAADAPDTGLEAVSFFIMRQGILVNRGLTSLGGFTEMVGDAGGTVNTMTGSVPTDDSNTLFFGSKQYRHVSGNARVSGAVFIDAGVPTWFNCLWVIKLGSDAR